MKTKKSKQWEFAEKLEKGLGSDLFAGYIGLHSDGQPHWLSTMYEKGKQTYEIRLFLDRKSANLAGFDKVILVSVVKLG